MSTAPMSLTPTRHHNALLNSCHGSEVVLQGCVGGEDILLSNGLAVGVGLVGVTSNYLVTVRKM